MVAEVSVVVVVAGGSNCCFANCYYSKNFAVTRSYFGAGHSFLVVGSSCSVVDHFGLDSSFVREGCSCYLLVCLLYFGMVHSYWLGYLRVRSYQRIVMGCFVKEYSY